MRKNTKRPTRRKSPGRSQQQLDYIIRSHYSDYPTYDDYLPPWTVYIVGVGIALGIVGLSLLLGFGRTQGWW